ncbi:DUF1778 domain-containing protein [Thiomicrorhabdus indica]|uniref:type II toxin-antitoxin system TacA family antitoxin n=1 Tax=Thiomicrorhabdus indica TaxID=2267253 RepID=UPI00102D8251|nr:DUF1778 domain-containing protein [Thiomicrorhabdus indica]
METAIDARIDLRTSDQAKQLIKQAALLSGQSMTDFILSVTLEKAKECLKQNTSQTVSLEDFNAMMEALEQPPQSNTALSNALKQHPNQGAKFEL